jgi:hypothetical protein
MAASLVVVGIQSDRWAVRRIKQLTGQQLIKIQIYNLTLWQTNLSQDYFSRVSVGLLVIVF